MYFFAQFFKKNRIKKQAQKNKWSKNDLLQFACFQEVKFDYNFFWRLKGHKMCKTALSVHQKIFIKINLL
ncbi:MAG: hypothetical protein ACHQIM_18590, partial [Sphingobacteriales bacterium]